MRRLGLTWMALLSGALIFGNMGCSTISVKKVKPIASHRHGYFDRGSGASDFERIITEEDSPHTRNSSSFVFQWPLRKVEVTSAFGKRGKDFHDGIDLRAPEGTSVYASHHGVVLYADQRIRGYGKLIVVKHPGKLATLYAHNSKVLVKRGDRVKRGQAIALSGETGHATGPHLHFEIRRGVAALNPLNLLPKRGRSAQKQTEHKKRIIKNRQFAGARLASLH